MSKIRQSLLYLLRGVAIAFLYGMGIQPLTLGWSQCRVALYWFVVWVESQRGCLAL